MLYYDFGFRIWSKMTFSSACSKEWCGTNATIDHSWLFCLDFLLGDRWLYLDAIHWLQSLIWWIWLIKKQLLNLFCIVHKLMFWLYIDEEWQQKFHFDKIDAFDQWLYTFVSTFFGFMCFYCSFVAGDGWDLWMWGLLGIFSLLFIKKQIHHLSYKMKCREPSVLNSSTLYPCLTRRILTIGET